MDAVTSPSLFYDFLNRSRLGVVFKVFIFIFAWGLLSPNSDASSNNLCVFKYPQLTLLKKVSLDNDLSFKTSYLHSVALSTVEDSYIFEQSAIIQTMESVADHGAGLPSMSNEPDMLGLRVENGRFIFDMHRLINRLIMRINPEYNNRLYIQGKTYDLTQWGRIVIELKSC